ncbi:MAG: 50S ribosomal protein L9 [Phycisphaeraceae bacterium]|nr:50S ribosomal protein L9 [Phycisphaeraceae bacterium]MCB9848273.1 50S ribosomal protein L9 [Phycisphaeraceae bacterium]
MSKTIKLLLTENVDSLGIVGDVVTVRMGYARNYLIPREMAMMPSDEAIAELAGKRAQAEKEMLALRANREQMIDKLDGVQLTLVRSCNDAGHLYGSVTQQDIAEALTNAGYPVTPRSVRLPHAIKRIDAFDIHIRLDQDLEADIKLEVVPDRELHLEERVEMEFDKEGELIVKSDRKGRPEGAGAEQQGPKINVPAEADI